MENRPVLEEEIRVADAIILVFSVVDLNALDRLGSFWLPYLQKLSRVKSDSSESSILLIVPLIVSDCVEWKQDGFTRCLAASSLTTSFG